MSAARTGGGGLWCTLGWVVQMGHSSFLWRYSFFPLEHFGRTKGGTLSDDIYLLVFRESVVVGLLGRGFDTTIFSRYLIPIFGIGARNSLVSVFMRYQSLFLSFPSQAAGCLFKQVSNIVSASASAPFLALDFTL